MLKAKAIVTRVVAVAAMEILGVKGPA